MKINKSWLVSVLLICFVETLGHGMVFSLFPVMVLGKSSPFFSSEVSFGMRGIYLGLVLGATPLARFCIASFAGGVSDRFGKQLCVYACLLVGALGYVAAAISIKASSFVALVCSRAVIGALPVNWIFVSASVNDYSPADRRGACFSWLVAASSIGLVAGFSMGAYLACQGGPEISFAYAAVFVCLCCICAAVLFPSDRRKQVSSSPSAVCKMGLILCVAHLLFRFGWSSYWDLASAWWMKSFAMESAQVSGMYAYSSAWKFISSLFLVPLLFTKIPPMRMLKGAMLGLALLIGALFCVKGSWILWLILPMQQILFSMIFPAEASLFSSLAVEGHEGSSQGRLQFVESLGAGLSPFAGGAILSFGVAAPVLFGGVIIALSYGVLRRFGTSLTASIV